MFHVYLAALQVFSSNLKFPFSKVVRIKLGCSSAVWVCLPLLRVARYTEQLQTSNTKLCVWSPHLDYLTPFLCLSFISDFTNRGLCMEIRILRDKLKQLCSFSLLKIPPSCRNLFSPTQSMVAVLLLTMSVDEFFSFLSQTYLLFMKTPLSAVKWAVSV